ncbi:hypothetical protein PENNAL_c0173G00330 [Penicillium nalgiovense]|uniref:Uncharacterized protein n=1 Tax=Penicillium nalgiovense TaxID=60175 RepID=A0A1V6WWF4_PENNA|nr:hypothetical protein PENNAL_c0173G00330 [Penicillium nalgiovense]
MVSYNPIRGCVLGRSHEKDVLDAMYLLLQ